MKIGFSFGRGVRDIVKGLVAYDDVFLIVSSTAIRDSSHIEGVILEYSYRQDYLANLDTQECLDIAERLYLDNKLIQSKVIFGTRPVRISEDQVWMDLAPTVVDESANAEQVMKSWRQYQLALKMSATTSLSRKTSPPNFNDDF